MWWLQKNILQNWWFLQKEKTPAFRSLFDVASKIWKWAQLKFKIGKNDNTKKLSETKTLRTKAFSLSLLSFTFSPRKLKTKV